MRRFEVLNRIAEISDRGGSLAETLDAVCETIVPELGDFCMIDLIAPEGMRRAAVRVGPGGGERAVQGLASDGPRCRSAWKRTRARPRSSRASSSG